MQAMDISNVDFSIEALEARFEMEAVPGIPTPDWTSTCTLSDK